jgi:predicted metalloprotease with PDZ domain
MTASSTVEYRVLVLPQQHELQVEMTLSGPLAKGSVHLQLPTWAPGDYSFAPQARDLFNVLARCMITNKALHVRRDGWQSYVVEEGTGKVQVSYTASAWGDDLSESAGLVDDQFAIVLGARYLFAPAHLGACKVHYRLPAGWRAHHPSGARRLGDETAWAYPSYEILLDTPVVFGHFEIVERHVHGMPFYYLFVDRGVGFEAESGRFADAVTGTVKSFYRVFGSFPFDDYTFVLSLNPNNDWGLEHLTSTMCGLDPDVFVDEDQFKIGVRVCAHELFHAWNVRRCRPAPLGHLETHLETGAFTEGLWVAEGFTRYYEFLSCARAGVYSASQFFSNLVGYYRHLTAQSAYQRVSAADSSYASYLNHAKYAGRVNNSVDYYDKGMLVAFAIDATLRTAVAGGSLDKAFKAFYQRFAGFGPGHAGYTTDDVLGFFGELHPPLARLIAAAVQHPAGLDTPDQLRTIGFEVTLGPASNLGLVFQDQIRPSIYGVLDDSPAGAAGLAPGDTIGAINNHAFSVAALTWVGGRAEPVTLGVRRGHRDLSFTLTPAPRERLQSIRWNGTAAQSEGIGEWLHQKEIDLASGKEVDLGFYENFHGVEIVV